MRSSASKPPPDGLAKVFATHPVETVLMLNRFGAERDGTVLPLLRHSKGYRWFALASLLLQTRARGFAGELLADFPIRLSIRVSDSADSGVGLGVGLGSGMCGCGAPGPAPGFPPLATYRFSSSLEPGAEALTDGVRPTYFVRHLSRPGETPNPFACDIGGPMSADRLAFVAAMVGQASVPLSDFRYKEVKWKGEAELQRTAAEAKREVEAAYTSLLMLLQENGWMTPTEAAALRPDIRVELQDVRQDRSESLPRL
jgi:hypothetical protein